jgi:hypothetical protein
MKAAGALRGSPHHCIGATSVDLIGKASALICFSQFENPTAGAG